MMKGRIALVTGAASGIGGATATLLAERGATVIRTDRSLTGDGKLEVTDEGEWERVVAAILATHGRLDILVHAAGISAGAPITDTPLAEWRRVLAVNLDGAFLATRAGIRAMTPTGGAIVLVGSASGTRPAAGAAAYSTSKAGLAMLMRTAAKECRDRSPLIRVNAVSPAGVKTPLWSSMPFFQELVRQTGSEDSAYAAMEQNGGGKFLEPRAVAEAIAFLASDEAAQITGVELPVDAGYLL
ncbi:MAG TPA: SDR family oxidoreductase [Gemmatimonadales bacterium]|nr:SDR family oxidoreductase [Gemmatimonadales bacterium]